MTEKEIIKNTKEFIKNTDCEIKDVCEFLRKLFQESPRL